MSRGEELETSLAAVAGDRTPPPVAFGVVTGKQSAPGGGVLVDVTVQPSGFECQARLLAVAATGSGLVAFSSVEVGSEVLLLYPGGDPNAAVALAGLCSKKTTDGNVNNAQIVDPGGLDVRATVSGVVEKVMRGETLARDLASFVSAFQTWFAVWSVLPPGTSIQNAAILTAQVTAFAGLTAQLSNLSTQLAASQAAGAPYIANTLRAE